jgi:hypothetical protein
MINIVFSKMEAYSGNFGISLQKLQQRNSLIMNASIKTGSLEDTELSSKLSDKSSDRVSKVFKVAGSKNEEEKESADPQASKDVLLSFPAQDHYIFQVV